MTRDLGDWLDDAGNALRAFERLLEHIDTVHQSPDCCCDVLREFLPDLDVSKRSS
jgi:hypothetical protein